MNEVKRRGKAGSNFLSVSDFFRVNGLPAGYVPSVKKYFQDCGEHGFQPLTPEGFFQATDYWREQVRENRISASTFNLRVNGVFRTLETWAVQERPEMYEKLRRVRKGVKQIKIDRQKTGADTFTPEELQILREAAGEKTSLIIELLQVTGCRVSEAAGITISGMKKQGGAFRVNVIGKGDKQRAVFLPAGLVKRAREVFRGKRYLLEKGSGNQYRRQEIATLIRRAGIQAAKRITDPARVEALRSITPHKLRHSFATNALKAGKDLATVSRYLGHSTVKVTADFYDHREVTPEEIFSVYGL